MEKMFCFQCEQTAGGKACGERAGVCGKSADVALLQDRLTGALVAFARAAKGNATDSVGRMIINGLFTTVTNVNFDSADISATIEATRSETKKLGGADEYNMAETWGANEDVRSLKSLLLFGIRGIAAYAYHALALGYRNDEIGAFFIKALVAIGENGFGMNELLPLVMEAGRVNMVCMELLDKAHTETYGSPKPT